MAISLTVALRIAENSLPTATPAHLAAAQGSVEKIKEFIKNNTFLGEKDTAENLPIDYACLYEKKEVVVLLLEKGFLPNFHTFSALLERGVRGSAKEANIELIELVQKAGFDYNAISELSSRPWSISLPLSEAIHYQSHRLFEIFMQIPPTEKTVNAQDDEGNTPLYYAGRWGNVEVIKKLLSYQAKKEICNKHGETPYSIAKVYKNEAARNLLSL